MTNRQAVAVVVLLSLPMLGLALLMARPELDVRWQHHPAHFWLVLAAAALSVALAYATETAARRRHDARVFLVSLAFFAAAGFLALHALATPPRPARGLERRVRAGDAGRAARRRPLRCRVERRAGT